VQKTLSTKSKLKASRLTVNQRMKNIYTPISKARMILKKLVCAVVKALVILTLLATSFTASAQTNLVPDAVEFAALKDLFDATNGAGWTKKTNWPTPGNWPASATAAQMDTWAGIVVTNGDITGILLYQGNLVGTLPVSIGNLTELTELTLYINKISGSIPTTLGSLTKLVKLQLGDNLLSGSIPGSLSGCTSLSQLFLYDNALTGNIPDLSGLTTLTVVSLYRNSLGGAIPSYLLALPNIQTLDLHLNDLSGTIPAITSSSFIKIDLSSNNLTGQIPSLGSLSKIIDLNLAYNALTGFPMDISAMVKLQIFSLGMNQITGPIPPQIGDLTELVQLILVNNKLSGTIPTTIQNLQKLKYLRLLNNQLTGSIPSELGELTTLETLGLDNNQLSGNIPATLGNLYSLTSLGLSTNRLEGEVPASLANLVNLTALSISNNQLTGTLPPLNNLTKLQYFAAGKNYFTGEIPSSYANFKDLITFSVENNVLSGNFPSFVGQWTKLTTLTLANNKFVGAFPSTIGTCPLLTSLKADYNQFTSVPSQVLNSPVLTILNFSNNALTTIPSGFSTYVNKANLVLTLKYNFLDFAQLEPLFSSPGVAVVKTLAYSPQNYFNQVIRKDVPQGGTLEISAAAKGQYGSIVWEKYNATWTNVNASNENATQQTYQNSNVTNVVDGNYRWTATNTLVTGLTLQSKDIIVKAGDAAATGGVKPLYNGLITSVRWHTDKPQDATEDLNGMYLYSYDDKYQIANASWTEPNHVLNTFSHADNKYRLTGMSYDPNGNIKTLKRYDKDASVTHDFTYAYEANKNKLTSVTGYVNQYTYNEIGQMTKEDKVEEGGDQYVDYDVTGKVVAVYADEGKTRKKVQYLYDDLGFRLAKISYPLATGESGSEAKTTWYIRDASGNVISIYEQAGIPEDAIKPITWQPFNNTVINGQGKLQLINTAAIGDAVSQNQLASGDEGTLEYTAEDIGNGKNIGFRAVGAPATKYYLNYYNTGNTIAIRKNGALQSSFYYAAGDVLEIHWKAGTVTIYQNNQLKFSMTVPQGVALETFVELVEPESVVSMDKLVFKNLTQSNTGKPLIQKEIPIYGSGKLGTYYPLEDGSVAYELTDHLGNVRALYRDDIVVYTATMEDSGEEDVTNPRVQEMQYFTNLFETEKDDPHMNHTSETATSVSVPSKSAYLFWQDGIAGSEAIDKSVGPAIALKVTPGDEFQMETFVRYKNKISYGRGSGFSLSMLASVLSSGYTGGVGFEAATMTETYQSLSNALTAGGFLTDNDDDGRPYAYLNYIILDGSKAIVSQDRIQVAEEAGFDPGEETTGTHARLAFGAPVVVPANGKYIYVWVSNGSENTEVWFDDLSISHKGSFVDEATDYGVWGDVLRMAEAQEKYKSIKANLFAQYLLDGNTNDTGTRGLNGVAVSGATSTIDRNGSAGKAYTFDGINDNIEVANTKDDYAYIHNNGVFSISLFVKLNSLTARSGFLGNTSSSAAKGFFFLYENGTGYNHQLRFISYYGVNGSYNEVVGQPMAINDNNWHHVAAVGDGQTIRIYLDGELDGYSSNINGVAPGDASGALSIGATKHSNGITPQIFMNGALDEIHIFNKALSEAEIRLLAGDNTLEQIDKTLKPKSKYRYGYQGQFAERDEETGWNHFEAREYDPIVGRWLSMDPAGQYFSPYLSMGNNPVLSVDPDGRFVGTIVGGLVGGIVSAVRGEDIWKGAFKGAMAGAVFDLVVATGGTSLPILIAAGAASGAYGNLLDQIDDMGSGKRKSISAVELGFSAAVGGAMGPIGNWIGRGTGGLFRKLFPNFRAGWGEAGPLLTPEAAELAIKAEANALAKGTTRFQMWAAGWQTASLEKAIERHAGPNYTTWVAKTGKTIFENPATGRQVVVDPSGYFTIFQPKSFASMKGIYLDMMGNVPAPAVFTKGGIKNIKLTGDALKQATHFLIE
jgi:RHS repeat-associated protein